MKVKIYILVALTALILSLEGYTQPVIADSTFNGTGRKVFSLGGTLDFGDNVAIQSDGKILMSGATFFGGLVKLGIVRMNPDGSYDPAFGTAGISLIDCGSLSYQGGFDPEMIIRPDGRILVCASTQTAAGGDDMMVCRLLPNGQLDNTFGTGGTVAIDMVGSGNLPDGIHAIAVDAAGNIYGCGSTRLGGTPFTNDLAIIKLTSAGVLDPAFSGDGKLLLDLTGSWDFGFGIAVQNDNKIVVTGYAGLPANFFGIRLLPNGDYDPTYSGDGKVFVDIFGAADEVFGMRMAPDEKVYIVGDGYDGSTSEAQAAVVRLTTTGDPDPTFSSDGIATFDILPGQNEFFKDLIIQTNGQCLVGGSVGTNSQNFSVFRMNSNGTLDLNFNSTGSYSIDVTGQFKNDLGYGMALQTDGKILLSGNTSFIDAVNEKYSIVRLIPNGVVANFTSSANLICEGSSVQFTSNSSGENLSYLWTFEGGTPATSTLANPLVTYANAGFFDVKLRVNNTDYADSLLIPNMIEVIAVPGTPAIPSGPNSLCNQQVVQYSVPPVQYATSYSWLVTPASAGSLVGSGASATFTASSSYSGAFSISVQATNQCGSSSYSSTLNGTVNHLPIVFTLEGSGEYCAGSPGATLTLAGSETGVSYQLYIDGVASGTALAGTGSALTWTNNTAMGFYTVSGLTANCSNSMAGQIYVSQISAPAQPATPSGPASVCNNLIAVYTVQGTTSGDALLWTLTPSNTGTLNPSGTSVSVTWAANFTGSASLTVQAQNICGNSPQSVALVITVNAVPAPVISGLQTVCETWSSDYQATNNAGSSYNWSVSGGTVLSGAGTSTINVLWGPAGSGSIVVTETNNNSCVGSSQSFTVLINPCTRILDAEAKESIQAFPNPAHDNVTVVFGEQLAEECTLQLSDVMGRVVFEQKVYAGTTVVNGLDVSGLADGYFTLFLVNKGRIVMQTKILKNQ